MRMTWRAGLGYMFVCAELGYDAQRTCVSLNLVCLQGLHVHLIVRFIVCCCCCCDDDCNNDAVVVCGQLLGVDIIACVSIDSAQVMGAWRQALAIPRGLVFFYSDPDGALGSQLDLTAHTPGIGRHYKRFVAVIRNGTVMSFAVDPHEDFIEVTTARAALSIVRGLNAWAGDVHNGASEAVAVDSSHGSSSSALFVATEGL